ncbi:MAG: 23S rRNA pseudouridine(1911/1915/1917) synthase RluD [Arenicellales bacterium WSBS_2016_MAG_OTU3]
MSDADDNLLNASIPEALDGQRFDKALSALFSQHSRSSLQQWLRDGLATLNGNVVKQRERVRTDDVVEVRVPAPEISEWKGEDFDLDIVFADENLFVINKPAGLVVHPGAGNPKNTLINALIHQDENLKVLPRSGIVHRIDKHTSGLLVVARNERARSAFIEMLETHDVEREYIAITNGVMIAGGMVAEPIARHPRDRLRMAVTAKGKNAITHYRVAEKFRAHTQIKISLETGRTHQVRVHMAHINFPLVGDPVYGGRLKIPAGATDELRDTLKTFKRQALHAARLSFAHPVSGEIVCFEQAIPEDMQNLISALQADSKQHEY